MEDRGTSHCIDGVEPVCGGSWDVSLHSWSRACVWRIICGMSHCIAGVEPVCRGSLDVSLHSWSRACVWRIVGRLIA